MAAYNYICSKCAWKITKDGSPDCNGCPSGSTHLWYNCGKVGSKNYICKKCRISLQSEGSPDCNGCPSGSTHSWNQA